MVIRKSLISQPLNAFLIWFLSIPPLFWTRNTAVITRTPQWYYFWLYIKSAIYIYVAWLYNRITCVLKKGVEPLVVVVVIRFDWNFVRKFVLSSLTICNMVQNDSRKWRAFGSPYPTYNNIQCFYTTYYSHYYLYQGQLFSTVLKTRIALNTGLCTTLVVLLECYVTLNQGAN